MTGRELRRLRLKLGLTQREMAKRLGLAKRTLGRYERGARPIPRVAGIAARCIVDHGSGR